MFWKIMRLAIFLCLPLCSIAKEPDGQFVTYAKQESFPLLEVLLDSVAIFSKHSIVVYGINADLPFPQEKYPFLIKKRLDVDCSRHEVLSLLLPRIILESKIKRGVYIDVDSILNEGCDHLFEHCSKVSQFPFCPLFPGEVNDQQMIMLAMDVQEKTQPYVHTSVVIFSEKCLSFMQEWQTANFSLGWFAPLRSETILNVMLWKHQTKNSYINLCDPYFELAYDYLAEDDPEHENHGYSIWKGGKIDYYNFHGCSNPSEARGFLNLLQAKKLLKQDSLETVK